jgi:hypothetical protein
LQHQIASVSFLFLFPISFPYMPSFFLVFHGILSCEIFHMEDLDLDRFLHGAL